MEKVVRGLDTPKRRHRRRHVVNGRTARLRQLSDNFTPSRQRATVGAEVLRLGQLVEAVVLAAPAEERAAYRQPSLDAVELIDLGHAPHDVAGPRTEDLDVNDQLE